MALFHITTRDAWQAAQRAGEYRAASLVSEGFIHLSTERQWLAVANRFYRDVPDLVLLCIREDRLAAVVRFERADGDDFPHLYGPLELAAVVEVHDLPRTQTGAVGVPASLASP
jgi:uncharacterized protein (DUF952 family)